MQRSITASNSEFSMQVLGMVVRSGAKKGQPLPAPAAEVDYCSRLNRALPPDIRVLGWTDVADEFHARSVGRRAACNSAYSNWKDCHFSLNGSLSRVGSGLQSAWLEFDWTCCTYPL